jgi:hypothetical protein
MHGYYKKSCKFITSDQQSQISIPIFDEHCNNIFLPAHAEHRPSETQQVVDMSAALMYVGSLAGSVRTNTASAWPMSDSGCELTVFQAKICLLNKLSIALKSLLQKRIAA